MDKKRLLHQGRCHIILGLIAIAILCVSCTMPPNKPEQAAISSLPTRRPSSTPKIDPLPARLTPIPTDMPTQTLLSPAATEPLPMPGIDPFDLISQESLFLYLEELTAIQAFSGWRNSATTGEAEAMDYVETQFESFAYLNELGLERERQVFSVYNATEIWETRLFLTVAGDETEVMADGIRGYRDDNSLALRFDSDGKLNDTQNDPVTVDGPVLMIDSVNQLAQLSAEDASAKIILLDYDVVHPNVLGGNSQAMEQAQAVLALKPEGIVIVTQFSDQPGASHGAFVGDSGIFSRLAIGPDAPVVPILYTRLEDLKHLGITEWSDLTGIESARLVWDMDVLAPGKSGNLAMTIPGVDRSKTLIVSAHIDSPNGPGAMDDGSGSVVLLEIARVLDEAQIQPPVDLMLVWYGSEELGVYGSTYFVGTHQELLDRTLAMLQVDCLTRPMEGVLDNHLVIETWSYGHFGDESLPWPEWLSAQLAEKGVDTKTVNRYAVLSDNSPYGGFDVPNANLIYISDRMGIPPHFKAHIHSPYDTVELARQVAPVLDDMAKAALTAVLASPDELAGLRHNPPASRRSLFLANHTEAMTMSPVSMTEFGMALALAGYDVDMLSYGQALNADDLTGVDLVVVLPVYDYGVVGTAHGLDEAWSQAEIDLLENYVRQGGFLLITNSANRLKFQNWSYDQNENWRKMNDLAGRFGIQYGYTTLTEKNFWVEKIEHPLIDGISYMEFIPGNAIPLRIEGGLILAKSKNQPVIVLASLGQGQVLALSDLGILGNLGEGTPENLQFWLNLTRYIE